MPAAISRLGDKGEHIGSGGVGSITTVSSVNVTTADGKPIALEGDLYTCPKSGHGTTSLTPLSAQVNTTSGGKRVITIGAKAGCGATIIEGYDTTVTEP